MRYTRCDADPGSLVIDSAAPPAAILEAKGFMEIILSSVAQKLSRNLVSVARKIYTASTYVDPEFLKTAVHDTTLHFPENMGSIKGELSPSELFPFNPYAQCGYYLSKIAPATKGNLDYKFPMLLAGIRRSVLSKFDDPQALAQEIRFIGEPDILFTGPNTAMNKFLPTTIKGPHTDISMPFVHIRSDISPWDEYFVFPVIPVLDCERQFGMSQKCNRFYHMKNFLIPVRAFKFFVENNLTARPYAAGAIVDDVSSENIATFFSRLVQFDTKGFRRGLDAFFTPVEGTHLDLEWVKSVYHRTVRNRLLSFEKYLNGVEYTTVINTQLRFFRKREKSYKTLNVTSNFTKETSGELFNLTFPIRQAPRFSLKSEIQTMLSYMETFITLREQSMEDNFTPAVINEIQATNEDAAALAELAELQNDPEFKQLLAAQEAEANLAATLDSLGIVPGEKTKKSAHVKVKTINTDLTREVAKLNRKFSKANEAMKRKTRKYNSTQPLSNTNPYYVELTTHAQVSSLFQNIVTNKLCGYDIETTGLHPLRGEQILTHQFSPTPYTGAVIRQAILDNNPDLFNQYKFIMESKDIVKVIHNLKFEYTFTSACLKVDIHNYFDTMVAAHMIDENTPNGLKYLAMKNLGVDMIEFDEVTYGTKKYDPDSEYAVEYACADADMALQLYQQFKPMIDAGGTDYEIEKSGGIKYTQLFYNISMPIAKLLGKMELAGIMLNVGLLNRMKKQVDRDYNKFHAKIQKIKPGLNPDSAKQLGDFLYKDLGLPVLSFTSGGEKYSQNDGTGQPSTDKKTLKKLAKMYPDMEILQDLIDYSELAQFKSLYLDSFPKHFNPNTCAIHTQIHQTRTVTSRFSSSDPNLQNLRRNRED